MLQVESEIKGLIEFLWNTTIQSSVEQLASLFSWVSSKKIGNLNLWNHYDIANTSRILIPWPLTTNIDNDRYW